MESGRRENVHQTTHSQLITSRESSISKFLGNADGNSTIERTSVSRITSLPLCFASRHHDHGKLIKQVALRHSYLLSVKAEHTHSDDLFNVAVEHACICALQTL
jgi:hypothetical protein